jgi:SAM-dependent methyltransferase
MSFHQWIKNRDREIAESLAGSEEYFSLSPTRLSLARKILPIAEAHLFGRCLDAGAGKRVYASKLCNWVGEYISMDLVDRPGLDVAGSVLEMPWRDQAFDSIFCTQVLEHVPEPERALHEFYRCLKSGGILVLSVPHLAYLHNEPHDYFRFTHYALRFLLERVGFTEVRVTPAGGLLSFLGHIPSLILKAIFFPIPIVNRWVIRLNAIGSRIVVGLDERLDSRKLFALKYIAIAKKPGR